MALSGASATNLKRSLDHYIKIYLEGLESINIDYEGVPFDNLAVSHFVKFRILDIDPTYTRQGSSTQYSELMNVLIQFGIFVGKGRTTTSEQIYSIRDAIFKYFKTGKDINLNDHQGDGSSLTTMRVRDTITDNRMPEDNYYYSYVLAFNLEYTRLTTN